MNTDPVKRLENTGYLSLFAGIVMGVLAQTSQTNQLACIILAGVFFTVGVFDELLVTMLNNRDPSKASPALFPLVLALLVFLILAPLLTVTGAIQCAKAQNNVSYGVKKGTGVVRRVYGGDTQVVIADTYKDAPVTVIEKSAFYARIRMETVDLPDGLKEIRANAFQGCTGLTQLKLPDGLEVIGKRAFQGCKNLKRIQIPPSVSEIPKSAFNGCPKDMIIVGEPGSAAQAYAEKYFAFEAVSP